MNLILIFHCLLTITLILLVVLIIYSKMKLLTESNVDLNVIIAKNYQNKINHKNFVGNLKLQFFI